ncbi:MAG TPA: cache domain-containing protein [Deltaproteobacteria bacterium]|nr:cache domain-containing protein [Deltaproteobacteria bacterium]OQC27458.1 MAG: Sensor protein ZraS [Deltaproteobacteria bacterium ADurb.Bin072]HNQ85392.1 cache domain-containing protein [Deltaproteobacteria bacterium]HNS89648.1 cache domain-containing protein [Deltaproteobacteria bacterium]HOA44693.1 cache domain-containing protein [Deltaproteobacteria bacterium]
MKLQSRLVIGFLTATCLTAAVASMVGITMINKSTLDEVQRKVQQDINTAKLVYRHNLERLEYQLQFIALRSPIHEAILSGNLEVLEDLRVIIRSGTYVSVGPMALDMLTLVDTNGKVIYRAANPDAKGDVILWDSVVRVCLLERKPKSSTVIMPYDVIVAQNPKLAERVQIPIVKTEKSVEIKEKILTEGMVLRAAYPIVDRSGRLLGALVGGVLLNRDYGIVDTIKETVYLAERYRDRDMGFATIFLGGVRISTNVMTRENDRAVGTIVSKEVYDQVIGRGKDWIGRAFVVNDWYISSYTPIWDIDNRIIGMLYTGILEAKYRDMMMKTVLIFLGVTALGMVIAFLVSFRLGQSIIRRIRILNQATEAIASGDLDYQLPPGRSSGFDMLDEAFNNMARSLKDRDDRLQKAFQRITVTERLASLGQMAAGVAHEINNPLGGILLYSNLVLEEMNPQDAARENMEKIIYQTERCKKIVQNLLDFARTPSGDMTPLSVNDVIMTSLNLVKDQSIFHGIEVKTAFAEDLPQVMGDPSRLEEVFLNLFINATDAMCGKGVLTIETRFSSTGALKILISDTGKGIDKAYLPHIFEPFFTTKDPGQGTGLGLSITYGIIQKHGGFIDVMSDPGKGTTFTITLPPAGNSSRFEKKHSREECSIG